ncbi:MAG: hypothetical protein KF767_07640 [Bdellovibrionaceae bacterium]|mgnify:CR=1 FL=1|nr:hypothetical protein [Pseudobdellovibrionaceae bacterium]
MNSFLLICAMSVAAGKIWSEGDSVYFRYEDRLGKINFPIYEGVVTPPMGPMLDYAAKDLAVFDGVVLARWDKKNCKWDKARPQLIECSGRGEILAPANVAPGLSTNGISTTIERNERLSLEWERVKFNWGVDSQKEYYVHHFVTFPFNRMNCSGKAD